MRDLRIGHLSTTYHTHHIIKRDETFIKEINRKIKWELFGTGPRMIDAFKADKLDLGYIGLPPAIVGIDQNVPIICIAGGHIEGTLMISQKHKFHSLKNKDYLEFFKQFIGKKIGVPSRGSIHDVILRYYLKEYDLDDKVFVRNYDQPELIIYDLNKDLIAGAVGTPSLYIYANTIVKSEIIISPNDFWAYNPSYGIVVRNNLINSEPSIILQFLKHHKLATQFLREKLNKAASIISHSNPIISQKYAKKVLEISPKYCIDLSENYIASTMKFCHELHNMGYIDKEFKVDDIFYLDFIKKIHPEESHY